MTTTRITAADGKQYDVTYTLTPAVFTPEVVTPAKMTPATMTITSVVPVVPAPAPTPAPAPSTVGTITSFTTTPNNLFKVGGDSYRVETAGKSYSLTNPDSQTLRFEIRPGDYYTFDSAGTVDRANIDGSAQYIRPGTPVNIGYQFMLEANGLNGSFKNTASWFTTGEMHNNDLVRNIHTSPPFAIQLAGDKLQVVARYCLPGGNPSNSSKDLHMLTLWTDTNPIKTGQYSDIKIQANFSNTSSGYLQVSVNGAQVVNYHGPLGYGDPTYWIEGLYRNAGPAETVAAQFRNLNITIG